MLTVKEWFLLQNFLKMRNAKEPTKDYTYTFFALFEYMIVFTNIAFHYHSGNIFGSSILMISSTDSQVHGCPYSKDKSYSR